MAELRSEVEHLRRQVHGLRSKLHGELAVLALRIEDNDRRAMRRRRVSRLWCVAAIVIAWLGVAADAVPRLLNGSFLVPGLLMAGLTVVAGTTIAILVLHNQADGDEQNDRYHNWFRLTARDAAPVEGSAETG